MTIEVGGIYKVRRKKHFMTYYDNADDLNLSPFKAHHHESGTILCCIKSYKQQMHDGRTYICYNFLNADYVVSKVALLPKYGTTCKALERIDE